MQERIEIIKADITKIKADAIVNAANSSLMPGGGVCGAIHGAGGPGIWEECKMIIDQKGECKTGDAVITKAGRLPSKFIIHAVGPVWHGGSDDEEALLKDCYIHSLELAVDNGCETIAFPAISTGIYGFPKKKAAVIAFRSISGFLSQNLSIKKVWLVCFDDDTFHLLREEQKKTR